MNRSPVRVEHLEEPLGQSIIEDASAKPGTQEHRFHDIVGNILAEPDRILKMLDSEGHLPFCFLVGFWRFSEPRLRGRPSLFDLHYAPFNRRTP